MNQERQAFWMKHQKQLIRLQGHYNLAFAILGMTSYYMIDKINAEQKYHWIRSDVRVLNRDEAIDGYYYRKTTGALAVSKMTSKIFVETYPFMKNKVKVLYNKIPLSFYNRLSYEPEILCSNRSLKIITIARLDPYKGIELAIEACKILVDKDYDIKWFVLGDGPYRSEIEEKISQYGLQEYFILLGFKLNTLSYIKDSDIFVHPSRFEGKSNAVDEAKFECKPIVVTNYNTVAEQIEHNVTGLIAKMTGYSLAENIEVLINDKNRRDILKKNLSLQSNKLADINKFMKELYDSNFKK